MFAKPLRGCYQRVRHFKRPTKSEQFWPPKPKLFLSAVYRVEERRDLAHRSQFRRAARRLPNSRSPS